MTNLTNSSNLWIIDTFTPVAFRGNPAAVYVLDEFPDVRRLQLLAARAGLSETAFVVKNAPLDYSLRWFTPTTEISLCGHATLAAAHVLTQIGEAKTGDVINFRSSKSGLLKAEIKENGIELDLPTLAGVPAQPELPILALGVEIIACEKNKEDFLIEVKDFETLLAVNPSIKKFGKLKSRGLIVTTATGVVGYDNEKFDFASRFFAPSIGILEDLVTSSAHTFLAPYWAKKLGKTSFHCLQASRAYGVLDVTLAGNRTLITGGCVTTLRGTIDSLRTNVKKELFA